MNKRDFVTLDNIKIYDGVKSVGITDTIYLDDTKNIPVLKFRMFDKIDFLSHCFSTRYGGVSEGYLSSMNLSYNLGDKKEYVDENFKRIAGKMGISCNQMVYSKQTHTSNVLKVTKDMAGMGVARERDFDNIDALVTNEKDICLVTSYADCIPVFLVDEMNKAIASIHAGWRGTRGDIVKNTVDIMIREYNTNPAMLKAFIGPGICVNCYEVDKDVANEFIDKYSQKELIKLLVKKDDEKFQLNLIMANYYNLIHEGLEDKNIEIADICTSCNSSLLFSHRASKGKRGIMCAFMCINR